MRYYINVFTNINNKEKPRLGELHDSLPRAIKAVKTEKKNYLGTNDLFIKTMILVLTYEDLEVLKHHQVVLLKKEVKYSYQVEEGEAQ